MRATIMIRTWYFVVATSNTQLLAAAAVLYATSLVTRNIIIPTTYILVCSIYMTLYGLRESTAAAVKAITRHTPGSWERVSTRSVFELRKRGPTRNEFTVG